MIDVIIPVYDGYEETVRCIESVLDNKNVTPFNLLVIDDCSPNRKIREYLKKLAEKQVIELLVNPQNKGFVGTVNRGMSAHADRDVILLNSDTVVANDWLDRICAHASADTRIATITPFSNNAEICSFPLYCRPNELFLGKTVEALDQVFASLPAEQVDVPTGVGFCMYIRRHALKDVGLFDEETFGRGYGEENDFCMRAAAKGWRNVTCTNVFVFHDGGVSFSSEKAARVEHAMKVLDTKYPSYHRLVHEHLQCDPERPYRVLAQLKCLQQSGKRKYLLVSHRLGGGVIKHLEELAGHLSDVLDIILLKPAENGRAEVCGLYGGYQWSLSFDLAKEYAEMIDLLRMLQVERIHLHHVMELDDILLDLGDELGVPYDVTLHDYYFVNANPTLTNSEGVFAEDKSTRDAECSKSYPVPGELSADRWREKFLPVLEKAARIFSPSERCRDVYLEYFSRLDILVAAHPDAEQYFPYPQPFVPAMKPDEKMRVLILGAMSREKGADVLERTATYRDPLERLEYHLLGYAYRPLAPEVIQHGPYDDAHIDELIARINPHLIWFPAQWHETYCYTLSAALRTGLPVLATDMGSFPERLANRPYSFIKHWQTTPIEWNDTLLQIRDLLLSQQAECHQPLPWEQAEPQQYRFLYSRDYVVNVSPARQSGSSLPDIADIKRWCHPGRADAAALQAREKVLARLIVWRELPVVRQALRVVPFAWQRKIKRWLSHRPIHEIVG